MGSRIVLKMLNTLSSFFKIIFTIIDEGLVFGLMLVRGAPPGAF